MHWFYQSIAAALLIVPAWLAVGFFQKNFGLRSEIFLVWYMVGVIPGVCFLDGKIFSSSLPIIVIASTILGGLTFGAISNIWIFHAVSAAPNPGLPLALLGITNVLVFVGAAVLGRILPKYFEQAAFDYHHLLGVLLVAAGTALIAIKR